MFAPTFFKILLFFFSYICNICQDNKFKMATQFGERIREIRTRQKLLLRQVASKSAIDTSVISKIERGERLIKKEQIATLKPANLLEKVIEILNKYPLQVLEDDTMQPSSTSGILNWNSH